MAKLIRYYFSGSKRQRAGGLFTDLCHYSFLNASTTYAAVLGVLGVCLSLYDILSIIFAGNVANCTSSWKPNCTKSTMSTALMAPEVSRDLKLISLVLSMEYYLLLIVGAALKISSFFVPWMIFYSVIIVLEFFLFITRTFTNGFKVDNFSLVLSIFVIYNWLAIFCAFVQVSNAGCR